jgi:hypothetical protein
MAIQKISTFEYPKLPENIASTPQYAGSNTFDVAVLTGYAAYVGQMPSTELIDSVFFRVGTSTGTYRLRVRMEDVSLVTGFPTGFLINPSASAEVTVSSTAPANYEVQFPQPFTIPQGTIFSLMIVGSAGGPTPSVTFANFTDDNQGDGFPYTLDGGTTPLAPTIRDDQAPGFGIGLNGVSAVPLKNCWPMNAIPQTHDFKSPVQHGNKIDIKSQVRVCGAAVWGDVVALSSIINLYNSTGTLLASGTWQSKLFNTITDYKYSIAFDRTVVLTPGSYYLAVRAGDTATDTTVYSASFSSTWWKMASPMGGTNVTYVSSNVVFGSNPSWTEIGTRQTFLGLLIDGVDDGISTIVQGETSSVFAT